MNSIRDLFLKIKNQSNLPNKISSKPFDWGSLKRHSTNLPILFNNDYEKNVNVTISIICPSQFFFSRKLCTLKHTECIIEIQHLSFHYISFQKMTLFVYFNIASMKNYTVLISGCENLFVLHRVVMNSTQLQDQKNVKHILT